MRVLMASIGLAMVLGLTACGGPSDKSEPDAARPAAPKAKADRFARLALDCVHREYPNKISHVMTSDDDIAAPRDMTPVFYGCFDWHSSVHGHWLLARTLNTTPDSPLRQEMLDALATSFTAENVAGELAYYLAPDRAGFERPYGIAWFLQLIAELDQSDIDALKVHRETLRPLEEAIVARIEAWLPKLAYPVRLGTHNQTAFAFGLMLDYARAVGNTSLEAALVERIRGFHLNDVNCPLTYEPSGEDFLSPCLMEADLMRRVMTRDAYSSWLARFLPEIPTDGRADWLTPGVVLDASDGKLVHLDGVNLSRAWALEGIASALAPDDPRRQALLAAARVHADTGLAAVSDEHYSGSHWLASFATYLTTKRGLSHPVAPKPVEPAPDAQDTP